MPPLDPGLPAPWPAGVGLPEAPMVATDLLEGATVVLGGWGLFLLAVAVLALLVHRARLPVLAVPERRAPVTGREWALAALACLLVAALVTWPMASTGALVQRNFDGFGSAWLLFQLSSGRGLAELLDTWLFALLGAPLAWVLGPVRAYSTATLVGVGSMGLAAWWAARGPFRLPPWPAGIAAVVVMANPLVGTAITEGHGGILVGPGLPLLLGALQLSPRERPWRWALLVAGAGLLCALQSGYFAYLAAGLTPLWCAWTRRPLWRVLALVALPLGLFALGTLLATRGVNGADSWAWYSWHMGALPPPAVVSLDRLAGSPPGSDALLHGTRTALIFVLLVLGVVAPLVRGDRIGRGLALLALVGVLVALGPELRLTCSPDDSFAAPLPFGWLAHRLPALALFRLPARALWLYYLAAGLGAARTVAAMPRPSLGVAAGAVLLAELLVMGARPWEARTTLATVPSAYGALEAHDTVLDLWPAFSAEHPQGVELKELSCFYQTGHRRQLPMACLTVQLGESRLIALNHRVHHALVQGGSAPDLDPCVTALAWHPDSFDAARRQPTALQLARWWGPPLAESTDAGERVLVFRVAPVSAGCVPGPTHSDQGAMGSGSRP